MRIFEARGDRLNIASIFHQLGMVAQDRRDDRAAEQLYQHSLAIKEELGDRSGIASTYDQLGLLAYNRKDYDTAEERYLAALAIFEEIRNRPKIAIALSQLGLLRTTQGRPGEAVAYQVRALAVRTELRTSTGFDLRLLGQQRAVLGDVEFERVLGTLLDGTGVADVMEITARIDDGER